MRWNSAKIIHVIVTILAWTMFGVSLIYLAIKWNALPDTIGVHFNPPTGEFDLYDENGNYTKEIKEMSFFSSLNYKKN